MAQKWTQRAITSWAQRQFNRPGVLAVAVRMRKEFDELIEALQMGDTEEAQGEVADLEIMLRQIADMLYVDLDKAVDEKMDINYNRKWEEGPDGDYQHVEE